MSHSKRDWTKYNKSLVNRGSLTFWIHKKAIKFTLKLSYHAL